MKRRLPVALAGSSIVAIISIMSAQAQNAPTPASPASDAAGTGGLEEIVVTARRKEERLQNVPQTVNAVTAAQVENYNLLQFSDITKLIAGIQIQANNINMRGVSYNPNAASAQPTTATYINDAPVISAVATQAIFDLGQVEVLRGPQGTLHGISTPSGAITFTTHRPDFEDFSGDVDVTVSDRGAHNVQAALNIPIIDDMLAVRLAGLEDESEGPAGATGAAVYSVHNPTRPDFSNKAGRVSVRFEPTEDISANVMYQRLITQTSNYGNAVFGSGSAGGVNSNAPAGYNGPVIGPNDRLAVAGYPAVSTSTYDVVTGTLEYRILGQHLTYVGSYYKISNKPESSIGDPGNVLLGYPLNGSLFHTVDRVNTHEFRIASEDRIWGMFDYVLGAFHQDDAVNTNGDNGPAAFTPGAFGAPGATSVPGAPKTQYQIDTTIFTPRDIDETSIFGNVTAHVTDDIEISGGVRHIFSTVKSTLVVATTPAFAAVALPAGLCRSLHGRFGATYPGFCDFPVSGRVALTSGQNETHGPTIYNASISYHFTPDLMVYFQTGSSWRLGPIGIGIANATNDPTLNSFIFHPPETSTSYEGGLKWTFLDHRARINVDYYHQTFDNYIYGVPQNINYLSFSGAATPTISSNPFFVSAPATVDGVDLDLAFDVTKQWTVSGNFSWTDSAVSGALPCNDGNFDGVPDSIIPTVAGFLAAHTLVAECKLNVASSTAPDWSIRIQSEYHRPITDSFDGFIRGDLSYDPSNANVSSTYTVPPYAILDLFVGIRSPDQHWEASVFAKNITDTKTVLNENSSPLIAPGGLASVFGNPGYASVLSMTPRREVGVNMRYAFGP